VSVIDSSSKTIVSLTQYELQAFYSGIGLFVDEVRRQERERCAKEMEGLGLWQAAENLRAFLPPKTSGV
jgi:hypothetical protein